MCSRKKLRAVEENDVFGLYDLDMCLIPNMIIPPKFKVPGFEKYKGPNFPRSHLVIYCRKMVAQAYDNKLMIHCFQDGLSGASLRWYLDLAGAFLKHYKYILDMAQNRREL